jgi:hypothetical protein
VNPDPFPDLNHLFLLDNNLSDLGFVLYHVVFSVSNHAWYNHMIFSLVISNLGFPATGLGRDKPWVRTISMRSRRLKEQNSLLKRLVAIMGRRLLAI